MVPPRWTIKTKWTGVAVLILKSATVTIQTIAAGNIIVLSFNARLTTGCSLCTGFTDDTFGTLVVGWNATFGSSGASCKTRRIGGIDFRSFRYNNRGRPSSSYYLSSFYRFTNRLFLFGLKVTLGTLCTFTTPFCACKTAG